MRSPSDSSLILPYLRSRVRARATLGFSLPYVTLERFSLVAVQAPTTGSGWYGFLGNAVRQNSLASEVRPLSL
ncbi:hypothetical protein Hanom_Chr08g00731601 [Helianthus anomalus]